MFDFQQNYREICNLVQRYGEVLKQCNALNAEIDQYKKQKAELYARFGQKYGNVKASEARQYTEKELTEMRMELANSAGFLALIKSMLGFGKSQKDAYRELMGKMNGLLSYIDSKVKEKQGELGAIVNKLYESSEGYRSSYKGIKSYSGCNQDSDWDHYELPESLENPFVFVGDWMRPLGTDEIDLESILTGDERGRLFYGVEENGFLRIPWSFQLSDPVNLCINYSSDTVADASWILRSIVYQMLRNIPQYYMEFSFMDAVTSGADFKDFIRLQLVKKTDVISLNRKVTGGDYRLVQSFLKTEDISNRLSDLIKNMTLVIQEKAPFETVTDYNREKGLEAWIPYQVIIAENLQEGYTDNDIKNLQYLMENSRSLGVFVILMNNRERWSNEGYYGKRTGIESCFSAEALQSMYHIHLGDEEWIVNKDRKFLFYHWQSGVSHPQFIEKVAVTLSSEKKMDNEFRKIFNLEEPFGQMDSTNGLKIPFAINQRGDLLSYTLGQALNAHGLICGGTGSGKSSLLHMLISSIVVNYSPEDMELWLADYKITEFYSYKTNTPPHIRFIGLSKSADFSYAFLDKIVEEMNRRQNLIAIADHEYKLGGGKDNITSFTEYRKINGRNSMRRLLIIIDEFHVMSQHAQMEPDYKTKLENILSETRALGIILLLSDQAIVDGLRGLSEKGKKQIKARIALSNYMDELKETLNERDMDKLRSIVHMKVGEVAVQTVRENEDKEEVSSIERAIAIYINGPGRYDVSEKARTIYNATNYNPDVFDERIFESMKLEEINSWEDQNLKAHRDGGKDLHLYIGRPVNLDFSLHFPLLQRKGNNLMCVSGTEEQQMCIIHAVIESFRRQKDYEILFMSDIYASVFREYEPEIREYGRIDRKIRVIDTLEDICYELNRSLAVLHNRANKKKYLIIWLGLDSIADLLEEESRNKPARLRALSDGLDESSAEKERKKITSILDLGLPDLDALLSDDSPISLEKNEEEVGAEDNFEEESERYDAREDIAKLIHLGPTCNVYHFVIYDSATALRDFREVKTSDFNHKIAFQMSEYEAGEYLDQPRAIRELPEHLGYYHNGRNGKRFIPYKL